MNPLSILLPQETIQYSIEYFSHFEEMPNIESTEKRNFLLITDTNIFNTSLFFIKYQKNIPDWILVLPAGEEHKNWNSIEKILEKMFLLKMDRSSVCYAVGGGVIGDMVGFASSIFMRGIPFVQVPTTVLSMVDSSVGGKTGVDTKFGKNLIGTFHQPEHVYICAEFLDSLPFEEVQNGLAEMVKHALLDTKGILKLEKFAQKYKGEFQEKNISVALKNELLILIQESIQVKKNIVEEDEKEQGKRAWLNLGHTFGHAIELLSNFTVPHGLGVAKGIRLACEESIKRNILKDPLLFNRIQAVFDNFAMDISCRFEFAELVVAMQHDKKKMNGNIRVILPVQEGEMSIVSL